MDSQRKLCYLSAVVCVIACIVTILGGVFAIQTVPEAEGGCDPDQLWTIESSTVDSLNLWMTLPLGFPAVIVGGFTIGGSICGVTGGFCRNCEGCCTITACTITASVTLVICTVLQPTVFIMSICVHDWMDKECDVRQCKSSSSRCDCVETWDLHNECAPWCKNQWEYLCEGMSIFAPVLGILFFILWVVTLITGCWGCYRSCCSKAATGMSSNTASGVVMVNPQQAVVVGKPVDPATPVAADELKNP